MGDYQRGKQELVVSVRLIDAESHIIVAAVVGKVAVPDVEAELGSRRLALVAPSSPTTVIVQANDTIPGTAPPGGDPGENVLLDRPASVSAAVPTPAPVVSGTPAWSDAVQPARVEGVQHTAAPESPAPSQGGVEDFETWRARRLAESGQASPAPANQENMVPQPAPATAPTAPKTPVSESFPWRREAWLAKLLGIPAGTATNPPH